MEHADLADLHTLVRDGKWEAQVAAVRALVAHKGEKDENGKPTKKSKAYDAAKRRLPFSVVSGHYEPDHRHSPDPQKPNPEQPITPTGSRSVRPAALTRPSRPVSVSRTRRP